MMANDSTPQPSILGAGKSYSPRIGGRGAAAEVMITKHLGYLGYYLGY
jgi:hypothetical protein